MAEKPAPANKEANDATDPQVEGEVKPLDDEDLGGKKKSKLKLILLIAVPVVLLAAGGGLYFTGMLDKMLGKEKVADEHAAKVEEEPSETVAFIDMPDLLVNLSTPPGSPQRFLKMKIKLEIADEAERAKIEAVLPRISDGFQTFLREVRVDDMRGSAGMFRLRQELLYRVNMAARPAKVKDVLFQEILLQ